MRLDSLRHPLGRPRPWRAAVPCRRGTNKGPRFGACLGAANKACIDQRGAEGPDALQVLIEASLAVIDFGGLQSLAAAEPIKAQDLAHALARQTKLVSISAAPRDRTPSRS